MMHCSLTSLMWLLNYSNYKNSNCDSLTQTYDYYSFEYKNLKATIRQIKLNILVWNLKFWMFLLHQI